MLITDLLEQKHLLEEQAQNLLVVYPGRFQPWHSGHQRVLDYLQQRYGRDLVWVATSNKVEPPRSPFSFTDKVQMMSATGVHVDRIVETKNPYRVPELVERYDPNSTTLIFAVSAKDMAADPRFVMGTTKSGAPTYLQPMPGDLRECAPMAQHGYILTVPTFEFTVLGQPVTSATEIRAKYTSANKQDREQIIKDLFGTYNRELEHILDSKLGQPVHEDTAGVGVIAKNKKMARDPRYSMSMTQDVTYDTMDKNLRAFRLKEDSETMVLVHFLDPELEKKILEKFPTAKYDEQHDAVWIPRFVLYQLQDNQRLAQKIQPITTTGTVYKEDITDFDQEDPMNSRVAPSGGVGTMPLRDWKKFLAKRVGELNQELASAMDPALIDKKFIWDRIGQLLDSNSSLVNIAQEIVSAHQQLSQQRQKGGTPSRRIERD